MFPWNNAGTFAYKWLRLKANPPIIHQQLVLSFVEASFWGEPFWAMPQSTITSRFLADRFGYKAHSETVLLRGQRIARSHIGVWLRWSQKLTERQAMGYKRWWPWKAPNLGPKWYPKKLAALRVINMCGSCRGPSIGAHYLLPFVTMPRAKHRDRNLRSIFQQRSFANLCFFYTSACLPVGQRSMPR